LPWPSFALQHLLAGILVNPGDKAAWPRLNALCATQHVIHFFSTPSITFAAAASACARWIRQCASIGIRAAAPDQNDEADRLRLAINIWRAAVPLPGTLGERYFVEVRGLDITKLGDLSHCLRWHEGFAAVVALMTDPLTNGPCGIHRTFLNADATKHDRKMLGKQGVVRLSPDADVFEGLGIVEGIEDGLAVLLSVWHPVWVATSCGAIERFPVLAGIDALTIFRDRDDAGQRAAEACAERWTSAGREVFLV
jgi:Toprim domain